MAQRATVFLAAVGSVIGIALALLPLPSFPTGGTCGPGASSESAIGVKFDPGSVNQGSTAPAAYQQAFQIACDGVASDRLLVSGIVFGASVVLGGIGAWVFASRR